MEAWYNKGPRDWQNYLFALTRFGYIQVLFHYILLFLEWRKSFVILILILTDRLLYMIQLTLTLKMTTAQVVETSVTVNNNSPIQDYIHPDDQTQLLLKWLLGSNLSHWGLCYYRGLLYQGSTVYKVGSNKKTLKPKGTNDIYSRWPTRRSAKNLIFF